LWGLPPDDRRYYRLLAECCELDIPFCTQVGHAEPLRESEPGRPIPELVDYMHRSNKHKVLFGSNYPFWPASDCLTGLDKLGLSEKATALFFGDNAKRFFKIS
jgi:uncharacterized protein